MQPEGRISSYRDLKVWQFAVELAARCYELTKSYPRDEMFGLVAQMRRCSVSVAANIAEGYGREQRGAFVQFLRIAQGSLKELETHVVISQRVGFLKAEAAADLLDASEECGKMLRSLIRVVQRKQADE